MGHPSEKVVKLLPPVFSCKGSLNKACEVCFQAKHPREKFNLSANKASRIFKKVHCDLWGPYIHPSGTPYPIAHYVNCNSYSLRYRTFIAAILSGKEPRSFKEAMQDTGWRKSMQDEIRALENNGTWTMEDLPLGKKALGSQWVYRIKYKSDGSVERLKSRLVVLGNH